MLTLTITAFDVTSPVITRDLLQGSTALFGLLISLVGAGTVVAGTALMTGRIHVGPWRGLAAAMLLLA